MSSTNWVDNSGYTHLELYPNGKYKSFVPTVDTDWRLGNVDVRLAADHIVQFYESGGFRSFTLAEDVEVLVHGQAARIAADTQIHFFENGSVRQFTVASQQGGWFSSDSWSYRGQTYNPGLVIEFAPDGKVVGVRPKE